MWTGVFLAKTNLFLLKTNIKELEDYSLSDSDAEADVQLIEEYRRWGNRGNVKNYSIEAEFYDY